MQIILTGNHVRYLCSSVFIYGLFLPGMSRYIVYPCKAEDGGSPNDPLPLPPLPFQGEGETTCPVPFLPQGDAGRGDGGVKWIGLVLGFDWLKILEEV